MNKHEFQIDELEKLKLKVVALHDSINKEVQMTRPVEFVAAYSIFVS